MKKFLFICAILLGLVSCEKKANFIEGLYFSFTGEEIINLYIYEYEKGQYAWLINVPDNPNDLLGGKLSISFEKGDTLATFSKKNIIGSAYRSFNGLYDTRKLHYSYPSLTFEFYPYTFTRKETQPEKKDVEKMKEVMRHFTKKL